MSGRQWHWIAASTAAVAVLAAVVFSDTSGESSFSSHPFASAEEFTPEVGKPILATPPLDATTMKPAAPPPPHTSTTTPAVTQTSSPPPTATPPPSTSSRPPAKAPRMPLGLTLPVFFPDCETAWLYGAAPIRSTEAGYRRDLDRNRNGVACER
jgi:Excalibur calcium-binding domain